MVFDLHLFTLRNTTCALDCAACACYVRAYGIPRRDDIVIAMNNHREHFHMAAAAEHSTCLKIILLSIFRTATRYRYKKTEAPISWFVWQLNVAKSESLTLC